VAFCRYSFGFHEDGVKSGFAAAAAAAGEPAWAPRPDARPLSLSLLERAARASCTSFLSSFMRLGSMAVAEPGQPPRLFGPLPPASAAAAGGASACADAPPTCDSADDPATLRVTIRVLRPAFYWKLATRADMGLAVRQKPGKKPGNAESKAESKR
jgi:hypothetical protein